MSICITYATYISTIPRSLRGKSLIMYYMPDTLHTHNTQTCHISCISTHAQSVEQNEKMQKANNFAAAAVAADADRMSYCFFVVFCFCFLLFCRCRVWFQHRTTDWDTEKESRVAVCRFHWYFSCVMLAQYCAAAAVAAVAVAPKDLTEFSSSQIE